MQNPLLIAIWNHISGSFLTEWTSDLYLCSSRTASQHLLNKSSSFVFINVFWYWIDSTSHLHHAIMKVMGVISVIYKGTRNWKENSWETAQSQHNAVTFIKLPLSKNLSVCWNIKCLYCQICPCVPISYIWFFPLFGDWMQWLSFYSRTPSLQSPYNLSLARTQKQIGFLGLWVFPKRSLTNILYMLMWPGLLILQQAVMLCTPVSSIYSKTTA